MAMNGVAETDATLRQNAAFCLGMLCRAAGPHAIPHYDVILASLAPLFESSNAPKVIDNAAGAIARMIMANPQAARLPQVLPVLVRALPLRSDFAESPPVFCALCGLLDAAEPTAIALLPQIVPHLLDPSLESDNLPQLISATLKQLHHRSAAQGGLAPLLDSLSEQQKQRAQQLLSA